MAEPIAVGIIGCGAIAQISHIPFILNDTERFRLVGLADLNEELLVDVADYFHAPRRYKDFRHLLAQKDLEAVIICHSGSHHDTVIAALEANKHVFSEKPLGWNLREVEEIAKCCETTDLIVQVGYHKLYDPAFAEAKRQIQAMKDLGFARITTLHPTNELGFSPHRIRRGGGQVMEGHADPGSWDHQLDMQRESLTGGALSALVDEALGEYRGETELRQCYGNLVISLIHNIYMMYGFLGEPVRIRNADMWRKGMSIHVVVEFSSNLCCTLDWHFLSHLKDYREQYGFYGNHDRVTVDYPSPYFLHFPTPIIVQGGEGELAWEKKIIVSYEEAFHQELRAFNENVRLQQTPLSGAREALKHTRFIQEVIRSHCYN